VALEHGFGALDNAGPQARRLLIAVWPQAHEGVAKRDCVCRHGIVPKEKPPEGGEKN
jgi:hypothetical protein